MLECSVGQARHSGRSTGEPPGTPFSREAVMQKLKFRAYPLLIATVGVVAAMGGGFRLG